MGRHGGIAQLVERSPHTREVTDSSSVVSTNKKHLKSKISGVFCVYKCNVSPQGETGITWVCLWGGADGAAAPLVGRGRAAI